MAKISIEKVLEGLECVQVILNDMIITGSYDSEHLKNLEAVLQHLVEFTLRANMAKCVFFKQKIESCVDGLHQNSDKVEVITEVRMHTNVTEVKYITSMVNYYHKFFCPI